MKYIEWFLLCAILVPTAICMGTAIFFASVEIWLRGWERFGRWKHRRASRKARRARLVIQARHLDTAYITGQFKCANFGKRDLL